MSKEVKEVNLEEKKLFVWKENHQKLFLREVLALEPYRYKKGSKERGAIWNQIAENLVNAGLIKVTQRSVRDTFQRMMTDFAKKEAHEKRASGIEAEYGEIDQCLFEIKDRMEEIEITREEEDTKRNKEKATAEDIRKKATESLSQTKKRKTSSNADSDEEKLEETGKRKPKTSSYIDVMKESIELKKKEQDSMMQIKEKEMGMRAAEVQQQHLFQQQQQHFLQQQQQLYQQQQQQQQAMNFAMINAMKEMVQSLKK